LAVWYFGIGYVMWVVGLRVSVVERLGLRGWLLGYGAVIAGCWFCAVRCGAGAWWWFGLDGAGFGSAHLVWISGVSVGFSFDAYRYACELKVGLWPDRVWTDGFGSHSDDDWFLANHLMNMRV
jgi:hypothetical protein